MAIFFEVADLLSPELEPRDLTEAHEFFCLVGALLPEVVKFGQPLDHRDWSRRIDDQVPLDVAEPNAGLFTADLTQPVLSYLLSSHEGAVAVEGAFDVDSIFREQCSDAVRVLCGPGGAVFADCMNYSGAGEHGAALHDAGVRTYARAALA